MPGALVPRVRLGSIRAARCGGGLISATSTSVSTTISTIPSLTSASSLTTSSASSTIIERHCSYLLLTLPLLGESLVQDSRPRKRHSSGGYTLKSCYSRHSWMSCTGEAIICKLTDFIEGIRIEIIS